MLGFPRSIEGFADSLGLAGLQNQITMTGPYFFIPWLQVQATEGHAGEHSWEDGLPVGPPVSRGKRKKTATHVRGNEPSSHEESARKQPGENAGKRSARTPDGGISGIPPDRAAENGRSIKQGRAKSLELQQRLASK